MNDAAAKFTEIVKQFEEETKNIVAAAIESIHSDFVPHLNSDTDANAIYRANDIVNKILAGNYELSDCGQIMVNGWAITTLDSNPYNNLVDALAEKCADKAMQLKIERLEQAHSTRKPERLRCGVRQRRYAQAAVQLKA